MNKEKWINEVLQSVKEIRPVSSNPYMATRIEAKLKQPSPLNKLSLQWVYASAAIMLLLLVMNISVWRNKTQRQPASSGVQQLIQEYGWNSGNDLYSVSLSNRQHE